MIVDTIDLTNFRFSGHETFPCRYAWLPKAFRALDRDSNAFANTEQAMVELGVGKNMFQAIRFWVQVIGIAEPAQEGGYRITDFGRALLGELDPFLEDIRTLWLIHWKISTHNEKPLFAWNYLLYYWHYPEISRAEVLNAFQKVTERLRRELSPVTLEQHFDIFLHSYVPARSAKGDTQEDNLDCPLIELELIHKAGERILDKNGRREPVYTFRLEEKPEITPALFSYCLNDFWEKYHTNEQTLSFRNIAFGRGSPGHVFKLPEWDIRQRLDFIEKDSSGIFSYQESAILQQVVRRPTSSQELLAAIYK
jgi:hypothetical protein